MCHVQINANSETLSCPLVQLAGQIAYHSSYDPAASGPTAAHAVRSVVALIMHLTAAKTLTLRNKRLDADLAALAALVSYGDLILHPTWWLTRSLLCIHSVHCRAWHT